MSNELSQSLDASAHPESFDAVVLPHLDAANRLARWLMRNDHDADDVVQEASLRALRYFHTFTGGNGRAWFLRIVRNTCSGWRGHGVDARTDPFDEAQHSDADPAHDPETLLLRSEDAELVTQAMSDLQGRHRDLLVFRELEGLSYQEMAEVMGIPVGTVMSGLSRARQAFRGALHTRLSRSDATTRKTRSRTGSRCGAHVKCRTGRRSGGDAASERTHSCTSGAS
jgi:RNA polymerase sigma-70 factor (ECF subfamily)